MKFDTAEFDEELSSHLSFLLFQTILAIDLLVQMLHFSAHATSTLHMRRKLALLFRACALPIILEAIRVLRK